MRTFSLLTVTTLLAVAACSAAPKTSTGTTGDALSADGGPDADIVNVFLPDAAPQEPQRACTTYDGDPGCANKGEYFERCRAQSVELGWITNASSGTACTYNCCAPNPEPPLPPSAVCTWLLVGDGTTCAGAELEDEAKSLCAGNIRTVDFSSDCYFPGPPGGPSGPPGSTIASIECCTTPAP